MTNGKPYFGLRGKWLTFWITVACSADMTLYGYDQGVFGGVIVTDNFLDVLDIQGKTKMQSTISDIYDIGCFFGALSTILICHRLGRKNTIMLGTTVLAIPHVYCLPLLDLSSDICGPTPAQKVSSLGQCFCYLFITICIRYSEDTSFDSALQERWAEGMYQTEINSLSMRTKGSALGTAANWILNLLVVEITPIGIDNLRWRFYIFWVIFNAASVPIIYLFYPETSGRTLEDVDRFFKDNQDIIICGDEEATMVQRPQRYIDLEQEEIRRNDGLRYHHGFKGKQIDGDGISAHEVTHSEHAGHPKNGVESV